jgi:hypothetical protein
MTEYTVEPWRLTGKALEAYRTGFWDGNEGKYFPGGLDESHYDQGYEDGKKYGPRRGKPWTIAELQCLAKEITAEKE